MGLMRCTANFGSATKLTQNAPEAAQAVIAPLDRTEQTDLAQAARDLAERRFSARTEADGINAVYRELSQRG